MGLNAQRYGASAVPFMQQEPSEITKYFDLKIMAFDFDLLLRPKNAIRGIYRGKFLVFDLT